MQKFLPLVLLLTCFSALRAQALISIEQQEVIPTITLALFIGLENVEHPITTYKVNYMTTDAFGSPTEASGMVAIPNTGSDFALPIAVYNHGTVDNREAVPSRTGVFERFLVNALATQGYITIAPDYIGLGDSPGLHPYVHAESEAQAGYDLILALREWLLQEEIAFSDQLFTTGYSQGGHASMALQQKLQEDPTDLLPALTAAAHLSGPYSISDVMAGAIFDPNTTTLPGYLAYTYISYNYVYDVYDSLGQVFVEPYLTPIEAFNNEDINLGDLNTELFNLLAQQAATFPDMFQDSIQQILQSEEDSPILQALRDNDTYLFAPEAPTLLVFCTQDEQVPYQNALLADSVMTQVLGSDQIEIINGGAFDHGGCVQPAMLEAIAFFNGYNTTNATIDIAGTKALEISPNPVASGGHLSFNDPLSSNAQFQFVSPNGQLLQSGFLAAGSQQLQLPNLSSGIYFLRIFGETLTTNKIIIR